MLNMDEFSEKNCFSLHLFVLSLTRLVSSPPALSHLRRCSPFPHVRGQTPRLQETPVGRTHQLALQNRTHGLERGLNQSKKKK